MSQRVAGTGPSTQRRVIGTVLLTHFLSYSQYPIKTDQVICMRRLARQLRENGYHRTHEVRNWNESEDRPLDSYEGLEYIQSES